MKSDFSNFFQPEELELAKKSSYEVGEIFFFENSFEVAIKDPKEKKSFFPFLSLSDEGEVLDGFCTCKESEQKEKCPHLALAYVTLAPEHQAPLHVRFGQSFWRILFELFFERLGSDARIFKKERNSYRVFSSTHVELVNFTFVSKIFEKKFLDLLNPPDEKEGKTSLKLSHFSQEEIEAWKQHKATHETSFKLSFWYDLASFIFLLGEKNEPYEVFFEGEEKQKLPSYVKVEFLKKCKLKLFLSESTWVKIIPFLHSIKAPLKVFSFPDEGIKEIVFDQDNFQFQLIMQEKKEFIYPKEGIEIDGWIYVENKGFFAKPAENLFLEREIHKEKIAETLSLYPMLFQKYLKNVKVFSEKIPVKYHLFFDDKENLHIEPYLFELGDLQKSTSTLLQDWAYIEKKGFFHLEEVLFPNPFYIIPKDEVGHFVTTHRLWLHNFSNFQTHFGSLSFHFTYEVTSDGDLVFDSKMNLSDTWIDFGEWIYIRHLGFFAKPMQGGFMPLRAGLRIAKKDVSHFIQTYTQELKEVPSFFSNLCPYQERGLKIFINDENCIEVKMEYRLLPKIDATDLLFYENYIYMKNKGFFEITTSLPTFLEKYSTSQTIPKSEEVFFLKTELEGLKPYILELDSRLKKPLSLTAKIHGLTKDRKKGSFLYQLQIVYESEIGHVPAHELYKAFRENQKVLFSSAGLIFLSELRFLWIKQLPTSSVKEQFFILSPMQWIKLYLMENITPPKEESEESRKIFEELQNFTTEEFEEDLSLLKSDLRPYQKLGARWLWFLYCHGLSGLLCDEMGLGKSHQAMALLAASIAMDPMHMNKYLIVTPTSVLYHWQELLKHFLPSIKVFSYHGSGRSIDEFYDKYDLLLTSYAIHRMDESQIQKINFEVAIFDEIQIAKNPTSKTHKALRNILAKMKLGLTGTPIENELKDLKALFDIVLPSYLPSESFFREQFVLPIEKEKDDERKTLLHRLIHPFILRRKKSQVLLDLPEKIEQLAFCDLSPEQKELYHHVVEESKQDIFPSLKEKEKPIPYTHIFSIFSKLKQICDHPSLVIKDENYFSHTSGKWDLFLELLQEALESEQKVVVFSQYLEMIKIIETHLKKKGIGYAAIKGSTRNRKEQLQKFKEDPRCSVFVGSLLAVGLGVDLSAASVVIHYDRWWNPAKENQATDRVHRIGQTRGVQIFKLVTKHSIEEHIHLILEKKKELFEKIVIEDESDQMKVLTREDLIEVLEKIYSEDSSESS